MRELMKAKLIKYVNDSVKEAYNADTVKEIWKILDRAYGTCMYYESCTGETEFVEKIWSEALKKIRQLAAVQVVITVGTQL